MYPLVILLLWHISWNQSHCEAAARPGNEEETDGQTKIALAGYLQGANEIDDVITSGDPSSYE